MEQKLKFISMSNDKPLDSRTINLFNSLRDMRKKHREENFQDWLQKYNDDNVPNVNFIKWFIDEMR
jgi:hypothetical protein